MKNEFFTADLHFGHKMVANIRGFQSTEEHDRHILSNFADVLKKGDRLYVLGDLSGGDQEDHALWTLEWLSWEIGIELHLIHGNHDSSHPMHRRSDKPETQVAFRRVFDSMDTMGTIRHRKEKVMMSHFPYDTDRGALRYPEYRLTDRGVPIIHGHTHASQKKSYSNKGTLQVCVSLDAWDMKPALKHQLTDIIDSDADTRLDIHGQTR